MTITQPKPALPQNPTLGCYSSQQELSQFGAVKWDRSAASMVGLRANNVQVWLMKSLLGCTLPKYRLPYLTKWALNEIGNPTIFTLKNTLACAFLKTNI